MEMIEPLGIDSRLVGVNVAYAMMSNRLLPFIDTVRPKIRGIAKQSVLRLLWGNFLTVVDREWTTVSPHDLDRHVTSGVVH